MSDKPKCPVFGCSIPRGIPHSHPAGVSSVMRDPHAPLDETERSELERLRRQLHASAVDAERRAMEPPRHTFVKIVGRICLMIAIAFGLSSALVLIAMSAGWL